MGPSQRQEAVKALQGSGLSQREACKIIRARRRSQRARPNAKAWEDAHMIARLTELAQRWPRRGCRRLYDRYERDARAGDAYMNFKRFRRLYRLGNLQLHRRRRRSRAKYVRGLPLRRATTPNEIWTMDFLSDRLLHGRRFRVHTLLDECSRYALSVSGAFSIPSVAVVAKLEEIACTHGYPKCLRVDNGPEHIATALERWADEHGVELLFIEPGKPTQNAFIESFNARVRDELLNPNRFRTIFAFNNTAEEWRVEYNTTHPHAGLDGRTPEEFLALYETTPTPQLPLAS
ncbi:MAG TPA: IS3 family transposase [Candidatus Tyrphobacter sp.]